MAPRKQSQIAERESEILRIASDIIASEGLQALTMENVLSRVSFSKGTLYNHFTCREDMLVAFHAKCFNDHFAFFERGALFRGRPRERFMAAGLGHEIKTLLDPQPFRFALTADFLRAASERWRDAFFAAHRETMSVFVGIVRDGIATGDLPESYSAELVSAAAWSIVIGAEELHDSGLIFRGLPAPDFGSVRHTMLFTLLDGFGWQPLARDFDYAASRMRALHEVYEAEARQLGLLAAAGTPGR